ncbi:MAG TPA: quinol:cytochrome C oxidoreductase [Ignavibacteria bacterium]|nr:quinol:cytochrome C oxidoreductase [Ignavibacteria bacterium]
MDYIKKSLPENLNKKGLSLLIVGVVILLAAFVFEPHRAFFDYLWIYMFLVSIAVGSLGLVALEYMVGATWSTPFRRVMEITASIIPFLVILVIPLFFGMHDLFHWTHTEAVQADKLLTSKSPYLNFEFFTIRTAAILLIWILFYWFITKNSESQDDSGDPKFTVRNIKLSMAFGPLFMITLTVTSIDWMMSLEPHWYSTMFGVYYFAGTLVAALSVNTFILLNLKQGGYLHPQIESIHFYSLSTLMFGFNVFWGYIGFSQYMLIWYADMPEETFWMLQRWEGSWKYVSIGLIFLHFVIPFLILVGRQAKTNLKLLRVMAMWLLVMHAYDLYWLIMPTYMKSGAEFGWSELSFPLIVSGLTIILFKLKADKKNLIPVRDPKLQAGLDFHL